MGYSFWLLNRIARASYSDEFTDRLAELGVPAQNNTSVITFISQVSDHVRQENLQHPESGHSSELASLALRRTFMDTVG